MTANLDRLAKSFQVPALFRTWLKDQGITKPDDLDIVTAAETSVEKRLIKASGLPETCGQGGRYETMGALSWPRRQRCGSASWTKPGPG